MRPCGFLFLSLLISQALPIDIFDQVSCKLNSISVLAATQDSRDKTEFTLDLRINLDLSGTGNDWLYRCLLFSIFGFILFDLSLWLFLLVSLFCFGVKLCNLLSSGF